VLLWNAVLFLVWLGRQCRRCCKPPADSGSPNRNEQLLDKFESRNARLSIEQRRLQLNQNLDLNVQKLLTTVDSLTRTNAHNREMLNTLLSRQVAGDSHSAKDAVLSRHQSDARIKDILDNIKLIDTTGDYCDEKGHNFQRKDSKGNLLYDAHGNALFYKRNVEDPLDFEDPLQKGYPEVPRVDPSDDGLDDIDFYGDVTQEHSRRRSHKWETMLFEWPGDAARRDAYPSATSENYEAGRMEQIKILRGGIPGRGRPISPFPKAGLRGRGVLWRWGTNWAADVLLTRFRRDPVTGAPLMRNGRRVLEFLCMKRPNGDWAIPGCMMVQDARINDEVLIAQLKDMLKVKVLQHSSGLAQDKQDKVLDQLFMLKPESRREAYSADPRNTDNAWIETECWHIHDTAGTLMEGLDLRHFPPQEQEKEEEIFRQEQKRETENSDGAHATHVGGGKIRDARFLAAWMMVHGGLKQFASHSSLLQAAADDLEAYYKD
jgi:hypothetical protein